MSAPHPIRARRVAPLEGRVAMDAREALGSLSRILLTRDPGPARVRRWTREIGRRLLVASPYASKPNFTDLHTDDLYFLFAAYDARFLEGLCGKLLGQAGLNFRLSSRMTRAGGKTTRQRSPDGTTHFEIAVATSILFDGFLGGDPVVTVCGLPCHHRLGALQRLFEHELVHLAEWLCWDESHCNRKRFQGIAARLFRHRAHTHELVTRSERAATLGIGIGTLVSFRYRGRLLQGRVNRITKRATVLVGDPNGELWSDGRRYVRYYVPLGALRPVLTGPNDDSGRPI